MPYIKQEDRRLSKLAPRTPGELNFAITKLVDGYINYRGLSYTHLNTAIGALECAKLELYRRVAAPYENRKMLENGDVFISALEPTEPPQ